jgi:hypothetical protein
MEAKIRAMVKTGHSERTTRSRTGLDRDDVPHGFLGERRWLRSMPLQGDRHRRLRGRTFFSLVWGSRAVLDG